MGIGQAGQTTPWPELAFKKTKPGLWTGLDHGLDFRLTAFLSPRLHLNRPNVNQILLSAQGVILLISAHIEKAPRNCLSSLQFYSKIFNDC